MELDPKLTPARPKAMADPLAAAKGLMQEVKQPSHGLADKARGKDQLAAGTGNATAAALEAPKPGKGLKSYVLDADERYEVKPGDTLRGIAQRELGDAGRWKEIFDLNRDKLPNPDLLQLPHAPLAASLPAEHLVLDLPPR